jgi:hypothetical protein
LKPNFEMSSVSILIRQNAHWYYAAMKKANVRR